MSKTTEFTVRSNQRSITLPGVPADGEYDIEVIAYRSVDQDVEADGVIESAPTLAPSSPYQPEDGVVIDGTVTLGDRTVAQVNAQVDQAKADAEGAQRDVVQAQKDLQSAKTELAGGIKDARDEVTRVRSDLTPAIDAAQKQADAARSEVAQARTDLSTTIGEVRTQADAARSEVGQARTDLDKEVQRAKDDASSIRQDIANVKQTADGASSSIHDEAVIRARDDSALSGRIQTVEADYVTNGAAASIAQAKVSDEAKARSDADGALSGRLQTVEADYTTAGEAASIAQAKVSDEATTRAREDEALSGRIQTIEADFTTSGEAASIAQAKVNDEATTRAREDGALAVRIQTTEAGFSRLDKIAAQQLPFEFSDLEQFVFQEGVFTGARPTQTRNRDGKVYVTHVGAGSEYGIIKHKGRLSAGAGQIVRATLVAQKGGGNYADPHVNIRLCYDRPESGRTFLTFSSDTYLTDGVRYDSNNYASNVLEFTMPFAADVYAEYYLAFANGAIDVYEVHLEIVTALVQTNALIEDEATARADAVSSVADRVAKTEAQFRGEQDSTLAARIRDEATTRANAVSSVADRTSSLEVSQSGAAGILNTNPNFAVWVDGAELPTGWQWWDTSGRSDYGRVGSGRTTGGYAVRISTRADQECGFAQMYGSGPVIVPGWYVMEAEVALESGTWQGAGLTIHGQVSMDFATEADTSGRISVDYAGLRRFSKLVYCGDTWTNWHPMTNWSRWARAAKTLTWYRAAVRPATDGEIIAQKAMVEVGEANARIGREETARADAVSAVAKRAESLEARAGSLEGQVGGHKSSDIVARLEREETARADAVSAVADRASSLEASSRGAGNLLTNSDFATTDGWRWITANSAQAIDSAGINQPSDDWHPAGENALCLHQGNGSVAGGDTYAAWGSSPFTVTPGEYIQGYCFVANHRCRADMLIYWLDAYGNNVGFQGSTGPVREMGGGRDAWNWDRVGFLSVEVPANARQAVMELRKYDTTPGQGDSWGWWWRPYVGAARKDQKEWNPYSVGSGRATTAATNARIGEEATASSNRDSALGRRIDTVETQANTDRTDYKALVRDEATARSNAVDAVATRTRTLESQANSAPASTINANPMFNAWPDGQDLPTAWGWWVSNGYFSREPSESNAPGTYSLFCNANGNGEHGLQHGNLYLSAGWFVIEAEVFLRSGTYNGAGVTLGGAFNLSFATDPDINGVTSESGPSRRKFSKLFQGGPFDGIALHPMANWNGFNRGIHAKEIYFNRVAIRPASDGEIKAQKADAALNAPGSGVLARLTDEETTRAREDGALAGRLQTIETSARDSGNMVPNTEFASLNGWGVSWNGMAMGPMSVQTGDYWNPRGGGPVLTASRSGVPDAGTFFEAQSAPFTVTPGSFIQFYARTASHRARSWTSIFFRDENGGDAGYAGENHAERINNGGPDITAWDYTGKKFFRVPDNARHAVFVWRIYEESRAENPIGWMFQPYVGLARNGQTEWNAYSAGSNRNLLIAADTRITDEATASANRDEALGGRIRTIESDYVTNGAASSIAQAKVNDEASTRAREDSALAGRIQTTETRFAATPVSYTARSYGNGAASSPFGHSAGLWAGDGHQLHANGRSYGVWVFDEAGTIYAAQTFDVYGNGEAAQGRGWIAMRDYLNGIPNGRTVVITTADEPKNNRGNDGLREAMERCGAGDLFFNPANTETFKSHSAYILIGRAGAGRGNGQEFYRGTRDVDSDAWLEVTFQMLRGLPLLGNAGMQAAITTARIAAEETARSDAVGSLAGRAQSLETQMNLGSESNMFTRIKNEETARSNADSSLGSRTEVLEVNARTTGGSGVARNPKFSLWSDPNNLPSDWGTWAWGGNPRWNRADGAQGGSPYAVYLLNDTASVDWGIAQQVTIFPGKWVIEVTARCDANVMDGAGITVGGRWSIDFIRDPDTTGLVGNTDNRVRSWTKMMDMDAGTYSLHIMGGWTGFGYIAPKYLTVFAVNLRPATAGEILAGKVNTDLAETNARLGREETARADAVSAITRRTESLESNYSTVNTNLGNWNNDRYQDYLRVDARVGREETARADAVSAVANRTSVVEAQVSNDSNNLLRNGTFNAPGWVGRGAAGIPPFWGEWSNDGAGFRGASPRDSRYGSAAPLQMDRQGINVGITQSINNLAPGWYALEVDVTGEDGNWSGAGIHCNFNNGYAFNYGFATNADTAGRTGDIGTANRQFTFLFYNGANTGTASFYIMSGWSGFQGGTDFGFWRGVYHRVVFRPATAGEILARKVEDSNLIARVSTTESAVNNLNGKVAAYWQVDAVAGNNRAQMRVHADANGGAGVDIVGDVRITGANGNGSTIISGAGVEIFYPNGQRAVRLGI